MNNGNAALSANTEHLVDLTSPPGPKFLSGLGNLRGLITGNMDNFFEIHEKWGDTVRLRTLQSDDIIMLFHPDDVETVLKRRADHFPKGRRYHELIPVLGMGLVNSDDELWRQQRQVVQKQFGTRSTLEFLPIITHHSNALINDWSELGERFERDISGDMLRATFAIAGDAFFGSGLGQHAQVIQDNFKFALRNALGRVFSPFKLPLSIPTPRHIRFYKAIRTIDEIIYDIIDDFIARDNEEDSCVLARLVSSLQSDEKPMDRKQLRDEVCTILMVGHETSSVSLCWLLYSLACNQEVQETLYQELTQHQWGAVPSPKEVQGTPYLAAVVNESLRIFPSVPVLSREARKDITLGGYRVKTGSTVIVSAWVTHRHRDYWSDPEEFRPDRWFSGETAKLPPGAYIPFGLGPRVCIGKNMALLELKIIVADILRRYRVTVSPGFKPVPRGYISLQPDTGMKLVFERRESA